MRVYRGGSWSDVAQLARASVRTAFDPSNLGTDVGFRLARGP